MSSSVREEDEDLATASQDRTAAPKRQERGRRRIEAILDVAEQVITEVGYDATTTNLIADRAGISTGSLYQYFANKRAIVEALAARYVTRLSHTHGTIFHPGLADLPIPEIVDRIVDTLVAFNLANPAAKTLLAAVDVTPELALATKDLHASLCDGVDVLIGALAPAKSDRDRRLAATTSIQIFSSVLPAVIAAHRRDRPRVIRELKAALTGYWSTLTPNPTETPQLRSSD